MGNDCEKLYSRREVLEMLLRVGGCAALSVAGLNALDVLVPALHGGTGHLSSPEALFQKQLKGNRVKCTLCPRKVTIKEGQSCYCRSRKNIDGKLYALGYDKPCIVNFDPIERAPLYHFMPGTQSMALGAAGCNMNCLYCQNYQLAQSSPERVRKIDLDEKAAIKKGKVKSITLTYTDASCQPEYLIYLAKIAKSMGIKVILCTGGYINSKPLKMILPYVDAFAITLKAATDKMYVKLTDVHMKPVLNTLRRVKKSGKWLEVVTLVVPGYNDDRKGIQSLARWIYKNLGEEVPWHLSRFTPNYKLKRVPPTPRRTLEEARKVGLDSGLHYVYITNLAPHNGNHTYCPKCSKKLIERLGFKNKKYNLKDGKCPYCEYPIPGVLH